jgi:hypothetical protein
MDAVPEVPNQNLIKDKAFDHEPYRSAIIEIIRNNNKSSYCVSSIYDVLVSKSGLPFSSEIIISPSRIVPLGIITDRNEFRSHFRVYFVTGSMAL